MNKWVGIGNVTKDIELRKTPQGKSVCQFTLAIKRKGKDNGTDFVQCGAFDRLAEIISQYVKKGHRFCVVGHVHTGSYQRQDGSTAYTTSIIVDEIEFLQSKNTSNSANTQQYQQGGTNYQPQANNSGYQQETADYGGVDIDPDDLPF